MGISGLTFSNTVGGKMSLISLILLTIWIYTFQELVDCFFFVNTFSRMTTWMEVCVIWLVEGRWMVRSGGIRQLLIVGLRRAPFILIISLHKKKKCFPYLNFQDHLWEESVRRTYLFFVLFHCYLAIQYGSFEFRGVGSPKVQHTHTHTQKKRSNSRFIFLRLLWKVHGLTLWDHSGW